MDRRPLSPPARPLVLIVVEDDDTRALDALALLANGFDVVVARDGAEGYGRAWKIQPDIIVTDLRLPDSDGWEFLHHLRRNPQTRDIPVVALSSDLERSLRDDIEGDGDGFAAFVSTPCPPNELAAGLRHVLDAQSQPHAGH